MYICEYIGIGMCVYMYMNEYIGMCVYFSNTVEPLNSGILGK